MRPNRLELSGFASFRDRTVVDFEGAELFVLAGPTGAGKSSIVDAIVFALYGSVPRYDDRRLVAPVISQGHLEARVRLDFTVEGQDYTAVRVVRRTKTGASTKEARLERPRPGGDPVTIAGSADELSAAVEDLLGLTFEHFTKTVVLPQGEFQEFLHARPKERQDLLVRLLDLGIYRRVASLARELSARKESEAATLDGRLAGDLDGATPEAVKASAQRVAQLDGLLEEVSRATPELERIKEEGATARAAEQVAAEKLRALSSVEIPDGVTELGDRLAAADQAVVAATKSLDVAVEAREKAEEHRSERGDPGPLRRALELLGSVASRREAVADLAQRAATADQAAEQARTAEKDAAEQASDAAEAVARLEREHRAHALRADLEVGAPCPVCDQTVQTLPSDTTPAALSDGKARAEQAAAAQQQAQQRARKAERAAVAAHERHSAAVEQLRADERALADLEDAVGREPTPDALRRRLDAIETAQQAVTDAAAAEKEARAAVRQAQQGRAALDNQQSEAWQVFDTTRDRVAGYGAPAADRDDLSGSWRRLHGWAQEQIPDARKEAERTAAAIDEATSRWKGRVAELADRCREAGVEVPQGTMPRDAAVAALERARSAHDQLAARAEEAERVTKARDEAQKLAKLGRGLGQHLNARNFEQWLLNRALRRLVVGASAILKDLSAGSYSLALSEDGAFQVVDHRNADELRSARTLSGGETFLASLALALALAEHVADLAAQGSARLEALFLDEGFGTLDADTLDVVAAAIEELGSRGRMVGLITHVRDLAERLPVRYEVRKTASTSTVEKVVI